MSSPSKEAQLTPEVAAARQVADEQLRVQLQDAARRVVWELERSGTRFAWLAGSPAVLGTALLIFIVVAWGFRDTVGASGTTSTALIVGSLLVLVPAVLAAWQKKSAAEHAQQVFELAEQFLDPPARTAQRDEEKPPTPAT